MQVFHKLDDVPADFGPTMVSVGNFDGVHRAHAYVLREIVARAKSGGAKAVAVSFEPHPARILRPDSGLKLLTPTVEKLRLLESTGVDAVLLLPFGRDLSLMTPRQFVERIPVQIPADAPVGQLMIMVGDGAAMQESSAAKVFVPRDLGQLVSTINKIKKNDRLYLRLLRPAPGVVIGTSELPNLPPSVVATLNNDRSSGGYTPMALSLIYERELAPAEFVIGGQQVISVTVK